MPKDETPAEAVTVNPGYAVFQIATALRTSEEHPDPATRERAREKAGRWAGVIEGIVNQRLRIGGRQPMAEVPIWATLEVVAGGFATGQLLAGGPLQPHEEAMLARIGGGHAGSERYALNANFLSDAGVAELTEMLRSGCYEIKVPEEGALLTIAWLLGNGKTEAAQGIIDQIAPHFATLRFYPAPTRQPLRSGSRVHLENVSDTLKTLERIQPKPEIMAQQEAIQVWAPFHDRLVALFLETVEGGMPAIQPDSEGRWVSPETGKFAVVGGWPCSRYAEDWRERATQLVSEFERLRSLHQLCGKPTRAKDGFARLLVYLKRCANDPKLLSGREVGMIRLILARHVTSCGAPSSEKLAQLRAQQAVQISTPLRHEIAAVVRQRLSTYPSAEGIDVLEPVIQPITSAEAIFSSAPAGALIPASICKKVSRCLSDSVDSLVEKGIITSGDTLARVVSQISSGIRAAAFDDAGLRGLYGAIYRAFRQRRSLLLLNLEKQVQIEELPWIRVIEPFRRKDLSSRDLSRQTLGEMTRLALRAFPQAIIPNKLLQEFTALAKGAEWGLPLVEELAADIFMDDFSPKFTMAAKQAAELLEGSFYARYYGLDCAAVRKLREAKSEKGLGWFRKKIPNELVQLCSARAGVGTEQGGDVARNGMVIEQAQIVTTHNLAVLFSALDLAEDLAGELPGMARRCFQWICKRLQMKSDSHHATLIALKNSAYAWRQMVFYLSHLPESELEVFLAWAEAHIGEQDERFQSRLRLALNGLVAVHRGQSLDDPKVQEQGARRFLGWTRGPHWLLGKS
jgi:hypothetical protein